MTLYCIWYHIGLRVSAKEATENAPALATGIPNFITGELTKHNLLCAFNGLSISFAALFSCDFVVPHTVALSFRCGSP